MISDFQAAQPAASLITLLRRLFDVTVALTGMLLFLLFLALVVLAIHLDSPGPILFSQIRLGQHGRPFRLYKFRKFHHGCQGRAVTLKDDDRMTRVGRILERTKIDEVPQLWNVLRGDMAIVGPRPETQDFADCFDGPYRAVLDHKPGIFGPNQVYFRNECRLYPKNADPHDFYRKVLFPAKARNDLDYFPRRSFGQDVVWILRGLLALLGVGPRPEQPRGGLRLDRLRNAPDRPSVPE